MSPERDDYEDEHEFPEARRSIFAATWFRVLLVVVVLGSAAAVGLPYALDWLGPGRFVSILKPSQSPAGKSPASARQPAPPPPAPSVTPAAPAVPPAPRPPPTAEAPVATAAVPAPPPPPTRRSTGREPARAAARGDYWVQVGAFSEPQNAVRLAAQLTSLDYPVQRATVTRGTGKAGNEVFVVGASQREVYERVKARGYRADAVKGGAAVRPPLPLRDAVALSKELMDAGMEVQIRRLGGGNAAFHMVRVGGFPDRPTADAAKKELADKGFSGFVVKGPPK